MCSKQNPSGLWSSQAYPVVLAVVLISILNSSANAQPSQVCSYRWNTSNNCAAELSCLDSASMQGKVITVPSNISRIAPDGLKLCLSDQNITSPADIVYIVDMSGSMSPTYNPPGDPYFKRADALRAGFIYQVDSVPGSYAGYMGFAAAIINRTVSPYSGNFTYNYYDAGNVLRSTANQKFKGIHLYPPKNTSLQIVRDSLDTLYNWLNYDQHLNNSVAGTNYQLAFSTAAQWFGNPVYSPHPNNRAIIFITDGAPYPSNQQYGAQINTLIQLGVTIYGIYLGSGSLGELTTITAATGGYAITVPPNNTDTLKTVVRNFVKQITVYIFDTLTVSANGITANALGAVKRTNPPDAFSGWELQLDKVLPLYQGNNIISVRSLFNSGNGNKRIDYDFTINVDPALPPNPSCYFCYSPTLLQILNPTTNAAIDTLTSANTTFKLRLSYYGSDSTSLPQLPVLVRTNKGDLEQVQLTRISNVAGAAIYERTLGFSIPGASVSPVSNNGICEAASLDILRARFVHPYDTIDFAVDSAIVNAGPDTIRAYRSAGNPASLTAWRARPLVDTITAGQTVQLWAKAFNSGLWLSEYETNPALANGFTWTIMNSDGTPATGVAQLSAAAGNHVSLTALQAYKAVDVTATLISGGRSLAYAIRLYIRPGAARALYIESSPLQSASPNAPARLGQTQILGADTSTQVYAVLRDSLGNYVGPATTTAWSSRNTSIATAAAGNSSQGQGTIIRRTSADNTTWVLASALGLTDSVQVRVSAVTYDALQIYVLSGGVRLISAMTIRTDQDTVLYARGMRSDTKQWELVPVRWTSPGISLSPDSMLNSNSYPFSPVLAGTGMIIADRSGTGGTIRDTVQMTIINGLASRLALYQRPGAYAPADPSNTPYRDLPAQDTIRAGRPISLAAKMFDINSVWLTAYESAPANQTISWRIIEQPGNNLTPTGALSGTVGNAVTFTPTRAYNTVDIQAEYNEGGRQATDVARFYIMPDTAYRLVIEPASIPAGVYLNQPNELSAINFASNESQLYAYALIRDRFGNFISTSPATNWKSLDSVIVIAREGNAGTGEGIIDRVGFSGQTRVIATNRTNTRLADTVIVSLSSIYYTDLRIVVNNGGLTDIDTLAVRTDQDTALYALGQRSDNGQWINVPVDWSSSLSMTTPAPNGVDNWNLRPQNSGNGHIVIGRSTPGGTVYDTVVVTALPGLPAREVLYPLAGTPDAGANRAYPSVTTTDTLQAGDSLQLVSKIFDHQGVWLDRYESFTAPVSWRIVELGGNPPTGTVDRSAGYLTHFTSTRAFNTVYIIADFREGSIVLSDTMRVFVKAGLAHHLVIEPSADVSASPNRDNPVGTLTFSAVDTVKSAYAVIRDQYQNFVAYSPLVNWSSLADTVVTVAPGIASIGEGRITRQSNTGATQVIAADASNPLFRDTVQVVLNEIYYTDIQIVVNDTMYIDSLVIRTDQDTTIMVIGRRSDNGRWELIRADWQLTGGLTATPSAPADAASWTFTPTSVNTGSIIVTSGSVSDTVLVQFLAGLPFSMVLYPDTGAPSPSNQPYLSPAQQVNIAAGNQAKLFAKLFDRNGTFLSSFPVATTPVNWRLEELSTATPPVEAFLRAGAFAAYTPTKAFRAVYVIAQYTANGRTLVDTVQFYVTAGPAHHLVIEANQNRDVSPNTDNPLDSIVFTRNQNYGTVYAILRDQFGNWAGYSTQNIWSSTDTNTAVAEDGVTSIGQGIVTRVANQGTTWIHAQNAVYPAFNDSVRIVLLNISYTALRIVVSGDIDVSSLLMSTNDDTTLQALGQRSDNQEWEAVQVKWQTSSWLDASPPAPELAQDWSFSPNAPADSGWIIISIDDDSTAPDSASVVFLRGAPTRADIQILTYPENRRAGDTIVAVVRLRNEDGLVPGTWCYIADSAALYWDSLGRGGNVRPQPVVVSGEDASALPARPADSAGLDQCFEGGVDTVKFVLYYAPYDQDSLHRFNLQFGQITAHSEAFRLMPASLDTMLLEDQHGAPLGDTVVLTYPDGAVLIIAMGYDEFGNKVGAIPSNWSVDGTLHPPAITDDISRVYYTISGATDNEEGFIRVVVADSLYSGLIDNIYVVITGYLAELTSAVTRDTNGNGYLDMVELRFTKPAGAIPVNGIFLVYGTDTLFTAEVESRAGGDSLAMIIRLAEDTTARLPQTGWLPFVSITGTESALAADSFLCTDGAGPVVWYVTKEINSVTDRKSDKVTVYMSEKVRGSAGTINLGTLPEQLFYAWEYNIESGTYHRIPAFSINAITSDAIGGISEFISDSIIVFYMANGFDLSQSHWMSVNDSALAMKDAVNPGSLPAPDNRKVRVVLISKPPEHANVYPCPARPTLRHIPAGDLELIHEPQARRWVSDENAGTIFTFALILPTDGSGVKGYMKIYDMAGNQVQQVSNMNLLDGMSRDVTAYDYDVYWNGTNAQGMIVAPGVYRYVIYLDYADSRFDTKLFGNVGISR